MTKIVSYLFENHRLSRNRKCNNQLYDFLGTFLEPRTQEWKRVNSRITGSEGSYESACQTVLTLFIIFTRADRQPSNVQIASLVAFFTMITRTSIAGYLSPEQPLKLKDELKSTATLLPLFFTNAVFKLLSLAITVTCLRKIALVPFFVVAVGFNALNILRRRASCCPERLENLAGEELGEYRYTTLQLKGDSRATKRQKIESCLLHNIIFHVIILTSLVAAANRDLNSLNYTVTDDLTVTDVSCSVRPNLQETRTC